jgi:hypothetical protein
MPVYNNSRMRAFRRNSVMTSWLAWHKRALPSRYCSLGCSICAFTSNQFPWTTCCLQADTDRIIQCKYRKKLKKRREDSVSSYASIPRTARSVTLIELQEHSPASSPDSPERNPADAIALLIYGLTHSVIVDTARAWG